MATADEIEYGLRNFLDGNKSLWEKTDKLHSGCGGTVWMLKVEIPREYPIDYKVGVCEKCRGSGSVDALLLPEELY